MHFRNVKDLIALPLHWTAGLPAFASRTVLGVFGGLARAAYFAPGSHVRRAVTDFCTVTDRPNPKAIYFRMIGNLVQAGVYYANLRRHGRSRLLSQTIIDPTLATQYERFARSDGGVIFLVPHCAGAVLSSGGLNAYCRTVLLVREPRSPARCEIMMEYLKKLGPDFILSRTAAPASVMRSVMRSLRNGKVVVGTTDVPNPGTDTVETRAFGQRIFSPTWPARISARFGIPIVPGFIHMEGGTIRMLADEGYVASGIQECTQRWVSSFESWFRRYPSDWVFMLDKRWVRVLAAAAMRVRSSGTGSEESIGDCQEPCLTKPAGDPGVEHPNRNSERAFPW